MNELGAHGERAENPQLPYVVFTAEQGANIDKLAIVYLAKRSCDFLFLRRGEESIPRRRANLPALDRGEEMRVNRAGHKSARPRNLTNRFSLAKAP